MTDYTIIKDSVGVIQSITRNKVPAASIPVCAGNSDYSQYLIDVDNGATVDEVTLSDPEQTPTQEDRLAAVESVVGASLGSVPVDLIERVEVVEQKLAEAPEDPSLQEQINAIVELINGSI